MSIIEDDFFTKNREDNEEVPYLNNEGDIIQDSVKDIKKLTENLQKDFISKDNIVKVDFTKNANKKSKSR